MKNVIVVYLGQSLDAKHYPDIRKAREDQENMAKTHMERFIRAHNTINKSVAGVGPNSAIGVPGVHGPLGLSVVYNS